MPAPLRVVETVDPVEHIHAQIGDYLKGIEPLGTNVLVVLYDRSQQKGEVKTQGGIIVPDVVQGKLGEDKYQGKACLVIKIGAAAFEEDARHKWAKRLPKAGDWVLCRHSDVFLFDLPVDDQKGGHRRAGMVEDVNIFAILKQPEVVW